MPLSPNAQFVKWTVGDDTQFHTFGSDTIRLYKLGVTQQQQQESSSSAPLTFPIGNNRVASMVAVRSDLKEQAARCFAAKPDDRMVVATGMANGSVAVLDLQTPTRQTFTAKHVQPVVHLAWNPQNTNLLASCHERYRGSGCVFVWDLQQLSSPPLLTPTDTYSTAVAQNEAATCCAWMQSRPNLLVVGVRERTRISMFDLREYNRQLWSVNTKGIYNICIDPFDENYLCSFAERSIYVYDMRTQKPLLVVSTNNDVTKIAWDPCQRQTVCSLSANSQYVYRYKLQKVTNSGESELSYSEHVSYIAFNGGRTSSSSEHVIDFDLRPNHNNHILALSNSGTIRHSVSCESTCARWDRDGRLAVSFDRRVWDCDDLSEADMNQTMRDRATRGYGLQQGAAGFRQMRALISGQDVAIEYGLRDALLWMERLAMLHEQIGAAHWPYERLYPSLHDILRTDLDPASALKTRAESRGFDAGQPERMIYTSAERTRVLSLCGWQPLSSSKSPSTVVAEQIEYEKFVLDLARSQSVSRAAALALFNLKCNLAVQMLQNANKDKEPESIYQQYQLVAMALAGFQSAVTGATPARELWEQMCLSLLRDVSEPYLLAILRFVLDNSKQSYDRRYQYESILECNKLPLLDKIAFACIHLPDHPLFEQFDRWITECIDHGKLDALALTGVRVDQPQCSELLQSYVDRTSDVQTVALLLIHSRLYRRRTRYTSPTRLDAYDLQREDVSSPLHLVDIYESLLNNWQLWHSRAQLDALKTRMQPYRPEPVRPQVFLLCTFCNQPCTQVRHSVGSGTGSLQRRAPQQAATSGSIGACINCNKPLPRCALCRLHMGAPQPGGSTGLMPQEEINEDGTIINRQSPMSGRFSDWFTWCQSCRHGGHVQHISDWFETNTECPVVGCSCRCAQLDLSSPFSL